MAKTSVFCEHGLFYAGAYFSVTSRAAGTFAPNESSSRAEAVSTILRVLNLNPEIKDLLDQLEP